MDPTRDVYYRNFFFNDSTITANIVAGSAIGAGISGCVLDSLDISDLDVVQFTEKRSQSDGNDSGEVSLGGRRIRGAGTLYARTRALLYDAYADMRAAMSPVLAQRESPDDHGYRPLYFSVPTNRTVDFPSGAIDLMVNAMPRGLSAVLDRDQIGGADGNALAIPFQVTWSCIDPTILGANPIDIPLTPTVNASGTWTNRGNYLAPVNALFQVTSAAGLITVTVGDSQFTITVPASSGVRIIRFNGEKKLITFEENSTERLAFSTLAFLNGTTWPLLPSGPSAYSIAFSGGLALSGGVGESHVWHWERYA